MVSSCCKSSRCQQHGMTLVEVLVAMTIAAVALVALMKIQNQAVLIQPQLEERFVALLLAENIAIQHELNPPDRNVNVLKGAQAFGLYQFNWTVNFSDTSQEYLSRMDIEVVSSEAPLGSGKSYRLTGFINRGDAK